MKKILGLLVCVCLSQGVFANDMEAMMHSEDCMSIAKACDGAGFKDKAFWFDCMRPVLMGKTVAKVSVDAAKVKVCRDLKIKEMKEELKELQGV